MIPLFKVNMSPDVDGPLLGVLHSGYIGQGPKVEEFEDALTPWVGRRPVTVNSGTSALMMALRLAGAGEGEGTAVISTPMTCSATNVAIKAVGARVRWADVNPRTGLIDPESVYRMRRILRDSGDRVVAVMAVDWGGQTCDYEALRGAADGVPVISDAAHSFGAFYQGEPFGTQADYTAFSFQAIKTLTTGDGGALVVPHDQLKRAKAMRWFGLDRETNTAFRGEQDITEAGYKFHMNDINATIGLENLLLVEEALEGQAQNAQAYLVGLHRGFSPTTSLHPFDHAWWLYTTLLPSRTQRDKFIAYMIEHDVMVSQVHWRNDRLSIFEDTKEHLPGLDEFSDRMVCLPNWSGAPVDQIIEIANGFFA